MTHEESPLPIRDYDATWPERYLQNVDRVLGLGDVIDHSASQMNLTLNASVTWRGTGWPVQ